MFAYTKNTDSYSVVKMLFGRYSMTRALCAVVTDGRQPAIVRTDTIYIKSPNEPLPFYTQ